MTKKVIRRLGDRLNHIFVWVNAAEPYDNIWDLCCDHGRLGLHLHERHTNAQVYLVDVVEKIMNKLATDFAAHNDGRLHFKTADVCDLKITTQKRTLVIIAGVGGQNLIAMLSAILAQLQTGEKLDFILSPNSHLFELRQFLRANNFAVIDEAFVIEKNFCHEHLWLTATKGATALVDAKYQPVTAIGDNLWLEMTAAKRLYIQKLLGHYQRMLDHQETELSKAALKAYGRLI